MSAVTLSPKYQVAIQHDVREKMRPHPGGKLQVIGFDDRIEPLPLHSIRSMKRFLKG